ncbi:MAG: helicase-related protein [Candidatus Hadarchaeales archaeon]
MRWENLERREYQFRLASLACEQNLMVVMPTALGKTVVAALAAAGLLSRHWDGKAVIMAPTRPLAAQHRETFLGILKVGEERTVLLTGEVDPGERALAWEDGEKKLVFATPQTVWSDLRRGSASLEKAYLVVCDECHRARLRYAYTRIAEVYHQDCSFPHLLALTASPGASKERILEVCRALRIERVEVRDEYDPDVLPYIHPVKVEWRTVSLPPEYVEVSKILGEKEREGMKKLEETGVVKFPSRAGRKDFLLAQSRLVEEAKVNRAMWPAVHEAGKLVQLSYLRELVESQGGEVAAAFLRRVAGSRKASHRLLLAELVTSGLTEKILRLPEHPKLGELWKLVSSVPGGILIFNHYRDSVDHLVSWLRGRGLKVERFVGQADREGSRGMKQEEQAEVLERFRRGELQALVLSSVGEEGLDIPSADLVIFYEPVPSEIRFIQRKGRTGRRGEGRAVVLVAEGTVDRAYMWTSRKKVREMRRILEEIGGELERVERVEPKVVPFPGTNNFR